MIIQQNNPVSALSLKSSGLHGPNLAALAGRVSPSPATNLADKVTISQAARDQLAAETHDDLADNWSVSFRNKMVTAAQEDPVYGEKITREYAYDKSFETYGPLLDISQMPDIRYSHTHELVTEENLAAFKAEAAQATAGRIALYEAEKAKGTSDADILQKLYNYTETQPDNYLKMVGWKPSTSATETPTYNFKHLASQKFIDAVNTSTKTLTMPLDKPST